MVVFTLSVFRLILYHTRLQRVEPPLHYLKFRYKIFQKENTFMISTLVFFEHGTLSIFLHIYCISFVCEKSMLPYLVQKVKAVSKQPRVLFSVLIYIPYCVHHCLFQNNSHFTRFHLISSGKRTKHLLRRFFRVVHKRFFKMIVLQF